MRIMRKLRTFNTIAFAVIALLLIALLLSSLAMMFQDYLRRDGEYLLSTSSESSRAEARLNLEPISAEGRSLMRFGTGLNGDRRDLGLIDTADGSVYRITNGDEIVSTLEDLRIGDGGDTDRDGSKGRLVGWIAYRRAAPAGDRPRFDVLAGRYSDVRQFVIAKGVETFSPTTLLGEDMIISAVAEVAAEDYRLEKFDLRAGEALSSKPIKLPKARGLPTQQSVEMLAATVNKFH